MNHKQSYPWQEIVFSGELLAGLSFIVYLLTLCPGIYGFDSAELATGVYTQGIVHPPGFPLYMLVGKLFTLLPIGSIIYRLNLMSAFFAAATIYFLYQALALLFQPRWISWVAAAFLAFSIYFWQMSVVAEVYTLHTFFLALELFLLLRWRRIGTSGLLIFFAFIYGLSLTNHTTGLFFAPGFAWLIVSSRHWKWKPGWFWGAALLAFFGSLLVYLYLPLRADSSAGLNYIKEYYLVDVTTLSGLLWMISGRAYSFFAFGYPLNQIPAQLWNGLELLWRNFIGVGALVALFGVYGFFKRNWESALGLFLIFLGNFGFYINYRVLDKDTMFLPSFLICVFFLAAGVDQIYQWTQNQRFTPDIRKTLANGQPVFWAAIAVLACALNWQWVDMSRTVGPESYSSMVLASAAPNSTIVAGWSTAVVLEYEQLVEGKRPDLLIYNSSRSEVALYYRYWSQNLPEDQIMTLVNQNELRLIDQFYQEGNVYSIEYDSTLAGEYSYVPVGVYYQLQEKAK
jgi:hypothetical protein